MLGANVQFVKLSIDFHVFPICYKKYIILNFRGLKFSLGDNLLDKHRFDVL